MEMNKHEPIRKIREAQAEVRAVRVRQWKEKWCEQNGALRNTGRPDLEKAPEPTDQDIQWPEPMLSVYWSAGYITLTVKAYEKLPKAQQNKIIKLGGL